jgi:23S rRNA (uracil1939-C5)-methyltransferase
MPPTPKSLTIARLGARGDGVAETADGPVFVPYALPGETVSVEVAGERGTLIAIESPSSARVAPFCPYFGRCGGCATQHMDGATYTDWKQGLVRAVLERAGFGEALQPLIDAHGDGRRRATFHARRENGSMLVGYMAARSHDLVAIDHCPILVPALKTAPMVAKALAEALSGANKPLDLQVTAAQTGLDVDVRGHGPASDALRLRLATLAEKLDLARLSLHGDLIVERRPPVQRMGRAEVAPQPGGFLQATAVGEETIASLAMEALPKAKRILDLFAGCGPFSLRLAERAQVHSVESDAAALAALDRAFRHATGLKPITTEARDLYRRPLLESELGLYDAVLLDPPRAGAEAQARRLAATKVPTIVYVSCDVQSFARDAAILIAGGYRLARVTPIDQFRYSAHIELVGVFTRVRKS